MHLLSEYWPYIVAVWFALSLLTLLLSETIYEAIVPMMEGFLILCISPLFFVYSIVNEKISQRRVEKYFNERNK